VHDGGGLRLGRELPGWKVRRHEADRFGLRIGERVQERVAQMGVDAEPLVFPDHHAFTCDDFASISGPIIMTEKDWVKCKDLVISQPVHVLRATATLPENVKLEINRYLGIAP